MRDKFWNLKTPFKLNYAYAESLDMCFSVHGDPANRTLHHTAPHCWKPVQLYCVHTVQRNCSPTWKQSPPKLDLSPGGPGRGQLTARPTTRWERPLSRVCNPFSSAGFPGLGRPRDCTPPRWAIVASAEAPATLATLPSRHLAL
jgi:hypothetical protein